MFDFSLSTFINDDWGKLLQNEFKLPYFKELEKFLLEEYATKEIFPEKHEIFAALNQTPFNNVSVVIIGQDPYHNNNQANGLCFSVRPTIPIPPSLKNIIKELKSDLDITEPMHGGLTHWAKQGVLLLNTVLTVKAHEANSHKNKGWEKFTDAIIKLICEKKKNVVFLVWGKKAAKKLPLVDAKKHKVLESQHPSPLSAYRGFFGCGHFSKTNFYLKEKGIKPVDWEII